MLSQSEIDAFISDQMSKSTKIKTECDLKIFLKWVRKTKAEFLIEDIEKLDKDELKTMLSSFVLTVKKDNGDDYEPGTLSSIVYSLDRHLQRRHYVVSLRGPYFKDLHDCLAAKRKQLKSQGKGRLPNKAEPVTVDEEKRLWDLGLMGKNNPESLLNALWWRNNFFGIRGVNEHRQMTWGDVSIETDVDGRRFIQYQERVTKTRKDPKQQRAISPRIFETPDTPETCPVELLLFYTHKRPIEMLHPDSPFYLQRLTDKQLKPTVWFKNSPLGQNSIKYIMKKMAEKGELTGRKTNHSGRKTQVKRLREANFEAVDIVQLTGHKNVASVNNYSNISSAKHRKMSETVTTYSTEQISINSDTVAVSRPTSTATDQTSVSENSCDNDEIFSQADLFELDKMLEPLERGHRCPINLQNCTFNGPVYFNIQKK